MNFYQIIIYMYWTNTLLFSHCYLQCRPWAGLCSSRTQWPVVPNFCSLLTRKICFFHTNHMLGTLDFTGSEHWAPFNFPFRTVLHGNFSIYVCVNCMQYGRFTSKIHDKQEYMTHHTSPVLENV